MAEDKFRMLLDQELTMLYKGSKSGLGISKFLNDTFNGNKTQRNLKFLVINFSIVEHRLQHEFSEDEEDCQDDKSQKITGSTKWFVSGSPVSKEMSIISATKNFSLSSGPWDIIVKESKQVEIQSL